MRQHLIEKEQHSKSNAWIISYALAALALIIFWTSWKTYFDADLPEQSISASSRPKIAVTSAVACGMVLAGQPTCNLACGDSQKLTCTWTSSCGRQACPSNSLQRANRRCEVESESLTSEQQECCTCEDVLQLRGGFSSSQLAVQKSGSPARGTVQMSDVTGRWRYPDLPETFYLGNDNEWQLPKNVPCPTLTEKEFRLRGQLYEQFFNPDWMDAKVGCNPYEPSSPESLGTAVNRLVRSEKILADLQVGWDKTHPTKVYAVGKESSQIKEIPQNREGIVVISKGRANKIREILDTSWWGRNWKDLIEKRAPSSTLRKVKNLISPKPLPPLLFLFVHQDECDAYLKELLDYPQNLFICCHSDAGSGVFRNKALGVLKERAFHSGVIIRDDVQYVDASRIYYNQNPVRDVGGLRRKTADNMLEVMFDVISGDINRATKWKGETDKAFKTHDFVGPWEIHSKTIPVEHIFNGDHISLDELTDHQNWDRYKDVIGLSKLAIQKASYSNLILWEDAQGIFARDVMKLAKRESDEGSTDSSISYSLLEFKVGKETYPLNLVSDLTRNYWSSMVDKMSNFQGALYALSSDNKGGGNAMAQGGKVVTKPLINYAALAVYQWAKLNIDETKDRGNRELWYVFNGLYNQRRPVSWALNHIMEKKLESSHPFKNISPAKLITLYAESNLLYLYNYDGEIDPRIEALFSAGEYSPYFDDRYDILNLPSNIIIPD